LRGGATKIIPQSGAKGKKFKEEAANKSESCDDFKINKEICFLLVRKRMIQKKT
jgi:hypothetical protein